MFWSIVQVVILPIVLGVIVQSLLGQRVKACVEVLPLVSVVTIVAIVTAVVAGNQERIATSGLMIFAFSVWHNISGPITATIFQRFKDDNEDAPASALRPVAAE